MESSWINDYDAYLFDNAGSLGVSSYTWTICEIELDIEPPKSISF